MSNSNSSNSSNLKTSKFSKIIRIVYVSIFFFLIYLSYSKGYFKQALNFSKRYTPVVFGTFYQFINQNKVLTLVIAFLVSGEVRSMNASLVDNIIMPILSPIIPSDKWDKPTKISIFEFGFGKVAADFIKFAITITLIFILSRLVLFIDAGK